MLTQTQQILQSTGLTDKLLAESKSSLTEKLGDKLEERLLVAIANNIPDDKVSGFEKKLENQDADIEQYLKDTIPNHQVVLKEAVDAFVADVEKVL